MTPSKLYELNKTMSCTEIAKLIGNGTTKNSVIGKIHRYRIANNLPPAKSQAVAKQMPVQKKRRKVQKAVVKKPSKGKVVVMPKNKTLADIGAKECRYPYGDKTPYTFCGCPQKEGSVYCEEHTKLCHGGRPHAKQWYERKFG